MISSFSGSSPTSHITTGSSLPPNAYDIVVKINVSIVLVLASSSLGLVIFVFIQPFLFNYVFENNFNLVDLVSLTGNK